MATLRLMPLASIQIRRVLQHAYVHPSYIYTHTLHVYITCMYMYHVTKLHHISTYLDIYIYILYIGVLYLYLYTIYICIYIHVRTYLVSATQLLNLCLEASESDSALGVVESYLSVS